MKRSIGYSSLLALTLLAGCGGDDATVIQPPTVFVDDLSTGAYTVSIGNINAPTVGKYYAGADGSRLLILNSGDDKTNKLYRRGGSGFAWGAVPAPDADITIKLLRSDKLPGSTLAVASVAGNYAARIASGVIAKFNVAADGSITASSATPSCKLSGALAASTTPNALKLSLSASGCNGALPSASTGMIVVDTDDLPAKFRIIADNEKSIVDLWAYRE